jgi:hypothetical protein
LFPHWRTIGARSYAGLSTGAHLYLFLVNNKPRTHAPRALLQLYVFSFLLPGFSLSSNGDAFALFRATAAAFFFGTATDYLPQSFCGFGMGRGTKYGPKQTIRRVRRGVISGCDSYPSAQAIRRTKKKLAQCFPMWRREVKIIRTNKGRRMANMRSGPIHPSST